MVYEILITRKKTRITNIVLTKEKSFSHVAVCVITELYLSFDLTNYKERNHTVTCPSWQFLWSNL